MPKRRRIRPASILDSFSPLRTLSQIVLLQLTFYTTATLLILFTTLVAGQSFSLDLLFSWQSLRADNTVGWMLGLVWMLNSAVVGVLAITLLVARSKLVLDFSLTLHFIHAVVTSWFSGGVPRSWLWWALQVSSCVLMISLATWTCQWRELRPIIWGGGGGGGNGEGSSRTHEYEMVPMKREDV